LVVRQVPQNPRTIDISQLASDKNDGRIKQLFILAVIRFTMQSAGWWNDRQTICRLTGLICKKGARNCGDSVITRTPLRRLATGTFRSRII